MVSGYIFQFSFSIDTCYAQKKLSLTHAHQSSKELSLLSWKMYYSKEVEQTQPFLETSFRPYNSEKSENATTINKMLITKEKFYHWIVDRIQILINK